MYDPNVGGTRHPAVLDRRQRWCAANEVLRGGVLANACGFHHKPSKPWSDKKEP